MSTSQSRERDGAAFPRTAAVMFCATRSRSRADGYLHNDALYIQADCRGRVSAHFNQPQFSRYSEGLRAFYLRDDASGEVWSAPYEPVHAPAEAFEFSAGLDDLRWTNTTGGIETALRLFVPRGDNLEIWTTTVTNRSRRRRRVSLFGCFPIGSPSPLYQRGRFEPALGGVVLWHFPGHSDADEYWESKSAIITPSAWPTAGRRPSKPRGIPLSGPATPPGPKPCPAGGSRTVPVSWTLAPRLCSFP